MAAEFAEAVLARAFVHMAVVESAAVGTLSEVVVGCKLDQPVVSAVLTLLQLIRYETYQVTLWTYGVYIMTVLVTVYTQIPLP